MALLQKGRHAARRLLPCAQPSSTPRTASWCPSFCRPSSSHVLVELRPWDAFSRHLRATPSLNTCVCHHQPYASSQKKNIGVCNHTIIYIIFGASLMALTNAPLCRITSLSLVLLVSREYIWYWYACLYLCFYSLLNLGSNHSHFWYLKDSYRPAVRLGKIETRASAGPVPLKDWLCNWARENPLNRAVFI